MFLIAQSILLSCCRNLCTICLKQLSCATKLHIKSKRIVLMQGFLSTGPALHVKVLGPGSHIHGPGSQVKGPKWKVPGRGSQIKVPDPGSHPWILDPRSQAKYIRWKVPGPESHFSGMPFKPFFIQKEVPVLVLSWQLTEIFSNNFFKEINISIVIRKKTLLWEKKYC